MSLRPHGCAVDVTRVRTDARVRLGDDVIDESGFEVIGENDLGITVALQRG